MSYDPAADAQQDDKIAVDHISLHYLYLSQVQIEPLRRNCHGIRGFYFINHAIINNIETVCPMSNP